MDGKVFPIVIDRPGGNAMWRRNGNRKFRQTMVDWSFVKRRLMQMHHVGRPVQVVMGDSEYVVSSVCYAGELFTRVRFGSSVEHFQGDIAIQHAVMLYREGFQKVN